MLVYTCVQICFQSVDTLCIQYRTIMNITNEKDLLQALQPFHTEQYSWSQISENSPFYSLRKAAVLIPLFIKSGEVYVWLTERSRNLRHDGGDVAFPGGMKDPEDSNERSTCLRESTEEIGLESHQVEFACQLLPRINRRLIFITPVIGVVRTDFLPCINETEVESAFYLPLQRFLSSRGHSSSSYTLRGITSPVHFFQDTIEGKNYTTWGLTAAMCVETAITVYKTEPEFEWTYQSENTVDNPFCTQLRYLQEYESTFKVHKSRL